MKKDFEENTKEEEVYKSCGMKEALSRPPVHSSYQPPAYPPHHPVSRVHESKENIQTQPYAYKTPFATDYPEKPKPFSKQQQTR
jgi:hypothetical protein